MLFRPRPDLSPLEAADLLTAFQDAVAGIPSIRRAQVGRRLQIGRAYEQMMRVDYPYVAVLEFDNEAGLRDYLDHPAHQDIGGAVFAAAADILVYDFETTADSGALADGLPARRQADGLRGSQD